LGQHLVNTTGILQRRPPGESKTVNERERDDPVVWLLLLERGRRTGDFELAARAKRELARLGIRLIYDRPKKKVTTREPIMRD